MLNPAAEIEYDCASASYVAEPVSLGEPTSVWFSNSPNGAARSGEVGRPTDRMMAAANKVRARVFTKSHKGTCSTGGFRLILLMLRCGVKALCFLSSVRVFSIVQTTLRLCHSSGFALQPKSG